MPTWCLFHLASTDNNMPPEGQHSRKVLDGKVLVLVLMLFLQFCQDCCYKATDRLFFRCSNESYVPTTWCSVAKLEYASFD